MPTVGIKKIRYEDSPQTLTDTVNKNFQILEWLLGGKLNGTNLNEDYLENFIANHVQAGDILVTKGTNARVVLNESQIAMQVSTDGGTTWVNKVYFDSITGQYIFDGVLSADVINALSAVVTPSIVADVANISDLTVSYLSTGEKALRYLNMDYSNLNYIEIYDQNIDLIMATNARDSEQATTIDGSPAYWVDETHNAITKTETDYPVYQFVYDELVKMTINFTEGDADGVPTIALGAGYGDGTRKGRGFIYKSDGGLYIEYVTYAGQSRILKLTESGIDFSDFGEIVFSQTAVLEGVTQVWVQEEVPSAMKEKDVWIDSDNFSTYGNEHYTEEVEIFAEDPEFLTFDFETETEVTFTCEDIGVLKIFSNIGVTPFKVRLGITPSLYQTSITGIVTYEDVDGPYFTVYPGECISVITI